MFCLKKLFRHSPRTTGRETMISPNENEIRGSHCGKDVDVGLLGCDAVSTYRYVHISVSEELAVKLLQS
jgi:hypothetical protein